MVFVRILAKLLKDKEIGKLIVPIVPDEARTFGMEAMFRQVGIYSHAGQLYEPVDKDSFFITKKLKMDKFLKKELMKPVRCLHLLLLVLLTTHGINMIPFFIYYSMFGLQRIGDLIWAAGDMSAKGFLLGGTAGRTTLNGEGLQHQDGHSHLLAYPVPNIVTYDPAFAYELAVIIRDGIKRMYEEQENIFYYITVMNENYAMPEMPKGAKEGILKGMYKFKLQNEKAKTKSTAFSEAEQF